MNKCKKLESKYGVPRVSTSRNNRREPPYYNSELNSDHDLHYISRLQSFSEHNVNKIGQDMASKMNDLKRMRRDLIANKALDGSSGSASNESSPKTSKRHSGNNNGKVVEQQNQSSPEAAFKKYSSQHKISSLAAAIPATSSSAKLGQHEKDVIRESEEIYRRRANLNKNINTTTTAQNEEGFQSKIFKNGLFRMISGAWAFGDNKDQEEKEEEEGGEEASQAAAGVDRKESFQTCTDGGEYDTALQSPYYSEETSEDSNASNQYHRLRNNNNPSALHALMKENESLRKDNRKIRSSMTKDSTNIQQLVSLLKTKEEQLKALEKKNVAAGGNGDSVESPRMPSRDLKPKTGSGSNGAKYPPFQQQQQQKKPTAARIDESSSSEEVSSSSNSEKLKNASILKQQQKQLLEEQLKRKTTALSEWVTEQNLRINSRSPVRRPLSGTRNREDVEQAMATAAGINTTREQQQRHQSPSSSSAAGKKEERRRLCCALVRVEIHRLFFVSSCRCRCC